MKIRISSIVLKLISAVTVTGVLVLNHFATTNSGVVSWFSSFNRGIESSMPLDFLKVLLVVISIACLAYSLYLFIKIKGKKALYISVGVFAAILCAGCLLYTIFASNAQTLRIYYFAILLFAMSTTFLSISNILCLKFIKEQSE